MADNESRAITITGNENVVVTGTNTGQIAHTIVNPPPAEPKLKVIKSTEYPKPDRHEVVIDTVVDAPFAPGLLILRVRAEGLLSVHIMPPAPASISMQNIQLGANFFSAGIPGPKGRYLITVNTKSRVPIQLDAEF